MASWSKRSGARCWRGMIWISIDGIRTSKIKLTGKIYQREEQIGLETGVQIGMAYFLDILNPNRLTCGPALARLFYDTRGELLRLAAT